MTLLSFEDECGNSPDFLDKSGIAIFQRYKKGLALRCNANAVQYVILIFMRAVKSVNMNLGSEYIRPFPLLPFWWALKLGIKPRYARFLAIHRAEYDAGSFYLTLKSESWTIMLRGSSIVQQDLIDLFKTYKWM